MTSAAMAWIAKLSELIKSELDKAPLPDAVMMSTADAEKIRSALPDAKEPAHQWSAFMGHMGLKIVANAYLDDGSRNWLYRVCGEWKRASEEGGGR